MTYLGLPSFNFEEVPGFFDADCRLEKKPDGLVFTVLAFPLVEDESAGGVFVPAFASAFADECRASEPNAFLVAIAFSPFLASIGRASLVSFSSIVFCFETTAALSMIFCASLFPWSSPLLTNLGRTFSTFVTSRVL